MEYSFATHKAWNLITLAMTPVSEDDFKAIKRAIDESAFYEEEKETAKKILIVLKEAWDN